MRIPANWRGVGDRSGLRRSEEVDADRGEFRGRESSLEARVRVQTGLTGAIEENRKFNQILIRETVSSVVGHCRRLLRIGRLKLRRDRVKLQHQQTEPADV